MAVRQRADNGGVSAGLARQGALDAGAFAAHLAAAAIAARAAAAVVAALLAGAVDGAAVWLGKASANAKQAAIALGARVAVVAGAVFVADQAQPRSRLASALFAQPKALGAVDGLANAAAVHAQVALGAFVAVVTGAAGSAGAAVAWASRVRRATVAAAKIRPCVADLGHVAIWACGHVLGGIHDLGRVASPGSVRCWQACAGVGRGRRGAGTGGQGPRQSRVRRERVDFMGSLRQRGWPAYPCWPLL